MEEFLKELCSYLESQKLSWLLKVDFAWNTVLNGLMWPKHGFIHAYLQWRVVTKGHNSRRKFFWNPQLSKSCIGLFLDIFSVKGAIGENNYVTVYYHFCHCQLFLSNLYFESYPSFVWPTGGISDSWCKGEKGKSRSDWGYGMEVRVSDEEITVGH